MFNPHEPPMTTEELEQFREWLAHENARKLRIAGLRAMMLSVGACATLDLVEELFAPSAPQPRKIGDELRFGNDGFIDGFTTHGELDTAGKFSRLAQAAIQRAQARESERLFNKRHSA